VRAGRRSAAGPAPETSEPPRLSGHPRPAPKGCQCRPAAIRHSQRSSPHPIRRDEDGAFAPPSALVDHAPYRLEGLGGISDWRGKEERHDGPNEGEPSIGVPIAGEREDRLSGAALGCEAGGLTRRRDRDNDITAQSGVTPVRSCDSPPYVFRPEHSRLLAFHIRSLPVS
jgi:hypothetical protein